MLSNDVFYDDKYVCYIHVLEESRAGDIDDKLARPLEESRAGNTDEELARPLEESRALTKSRCT